MMAKAPVRVCNPMAPTTRPSSVRRRVAMMRLETFTPTRRMTRVRIFLRSYPSGMGRTYEPLW
jgi:hypothetical protein